MNLKREEILIKISLNIVLPLLVLLCQNVVFFVLVTLMLIWSASNNFRRLYLRNVFKKILLIVSTLCWLAYHLSFLLFFVGDLVILNVEIVDKFGYVVLLSFFLGGLCDILESVFDVVKNVILFVKRIFFHKNFSDDNIQ